jgi:hypothetical protein
MESWMPFIDTRVEINAPAQEVWTILTDFEGYRRLGWNSYIESISGTLAPGAKITATVKAPELRRRVIRPRLVSAAFPELSWEVYLGSREVLHAMHYFRVEPLTAGTCRVTQGEKVSGLLTRTVFHLVEKSESGFAVFNLALKQQAERSRPVPHE